MSRLMGKLPFKGIYTPLRKPLCLPPRRFHYHSFPYSINACQGLVKTYDTLIQARAGFPTRMACVMKRKAKEAREKGEWIDIHDYDHSEPGKYDTIISNVNDEILRTEISEILGIPYLGQVAKRDAGKVAQCIEGYLHSEKCHPILPCVVHTNTGEARWVFFVMDITAPATYLSLQAHQALGIPTHSPNYVHIAGYQNQAYLSPADTQFADINILGTDFFQSTDACIEYPHNDEVRVVFGRWDAIQRRKEAVMRARQSKQVLG